MCCKPTKIVWQFHAAAATREPASYSFVLHFPTFDCLYSHCHLPVYPLLFLMSLLSSFVVHFPLLHFLSLLFPYLFVSVCLFVLMASAQAPLPLHLRTRLCLPPLIGQSVPTLARSVCRPRRRTMQVHGLSIALSLLIEVTESLQIDIILSLLFCNNQSLNHSLENHMSTVHSSHCSWLNMTLISPRQLCFLMQCIFPLWC